MPHRDEITALQARIEAQSRELEDTRAELALARAAHARQSSIADRLLHELDALRRNGESAPLPRRSGLARAIPLAAAAFVLLLPLLALAFRSPPPASAAPDGASPVSFLRRSGHVVRTLGPEVVTVGEQCWIERAPVRTELFDCRIEVRCGEQTLYGATYDTGYVSCQGRELVRDPDVTDRDGDPALTLDLANGIVTVEERVGMGTQRVEIALEPDELVPEAVD